MAVRNPDRRTCLFLCHKPQVQGVAKTFQFPFLAHSGSVVTELIRNAQGSFWAYPHYLVGIRYPSGLFFPWAISSVHLLYTCPFQTLTSAPLQQSSPLLTVFKHAVATIEHLRHVRHCTRHRDPALLPLYHAASPHGDSVGRSGRRCNHCISAMHVSFLSSGNLLLAVNAASSELGNGLSNPCDNSLVDLAALASRLPCCPHVLALWPWEYSSPLGFLLCEMSR